MVEEGDTLLKLPHLKAAIDKRSVLGGVCQSGEAEICWMFPLTMEKFRLKVKVSVNEELSSRTNFWKSLTDDQQLLYKSATPG